MIQHKLDSQDGRRNLIKRVCQLIDTGDTSNAAILLKCYVRYWRNN